MKTAIEQQFGPLSDHQVLKLIRDHQDKFNVESMRAYKTFLKEKRAHAGTY